MKTAGKISRAEPTAVSLGLTGYADKMVNGLIRNWALSALAKNPNILEQIECLGDPEHAKKYDGGIMPWYDEFPGKLLTGMAFCYAASPSHELKAAGDELADRLGNAQKDDGYLGIYDDDNRFGGRGSNWDVWGHYHMIYGLLLWHRNAGNERALETAVRASDCVLRWFVEGGRTFHDAGEQTMNLGISHALAEMYKETGDERYLSAAKTIVEEDWPRSGDWLNNSLAGRDYYQSPLPRWEALHTVMTLGTLYEITGEERYFTALKQIRDSIERTDVHNTGGFSSGEAACGDPYNTGAIEFCCTAAWAGLCSETVQLTRDPAVADTLELAYLNGVFGSLLAGERVVTYNTPMEGPKRVPSQTDIGFQYNGGSPDFNCCQANAARGLGEISRWAVLADENTVTLNYFGGCAIRAKTPAGNALTLTEETEYPSDGFIRVTLSLDAPETFTLALRIPGWADDSTVTCDGETDAAPAGAYFLLRREWKDGDCATLDLNLSLRRKLHGKDPARSSLYWGPVLLAAEGEPENCAVSFTAEELKAAEVSVVPADDGKHWLEAKIGGRRLWDFASAGKFTGCTTWLPVSDD